MLLDLTRWLRCTGQKQIESARHGAWPWRNTPKRTASRVQIVHTGSRLTRPDAAFLAVLSARRIEFSPSAIRESRGHTALSRGTWRSNVIKLDIWYSGLAEAFRRLATAFSIRPSVASHCARVAATADKRENYFTTDDIIMPAILASGLAVRLLRGQRVSSVQSISTP